MDKDKLCPLISMEPCIEKKCSLWLELPVLDKKSDFPGVERLHGACSLWWSAYCAYENAQYERQTGASIDKVATETKKGFSGLVSLAIAGRKERQQLIRSNGEGN